MSVSERAKVLVLAGETPVPPTSGVRLRVLHLARQLAATFDVELIALGTVPTAHDEPFRLVGIPHNWGRARPLALSLMRPYMAAKLDSDRAGEAAATARVQTVQAEFPYLVPAAARAKAPLVLDAHNVETEILRTVAEQETRVLHRLRARWEAGKTETFERAAVAAAAAVCATSDADAALLERWAREVVVVPNGVATDEIAYRDPQPSPVLLYVGHYGYRPNALAAAELVTRILPIVQRALPDARVRLVGREIDAVAATNRPDVESVGEVPETITYLHAGGVLVVPLRAGSGTRLKILEAMAAGAPIVATPLAAAGLGARDGEHLLLGETAEELANQTVRVLRDADLARGLARRARELVERHFSWSQVARPLLELHARLGRAA